jgi:apolipoprotein N-acyltransferase
MKAAPFICYEIIYPGFVQKRLKNGANLIVNITNDGWFGKSSGPFQHATMSRLRSIENGVQMVRCANSGISMHVDHFGRVIEKTGLYERTVLTSTCLLKSPNTFYSKWGDWIIYLFAIVTVCTSVRVTVKSKFRKPEKN